MLLPRIRRSPTVATWVTSPNTLPQALNYGTSVFYNGFVYYLGGSTGSVDTKNVYYATIAGPIVAAPSATTSSSTTNPDTGYGSPAQSNTLSIALVTLSLASIAVGIQRLYKKHQS